MMTRCFVRDLDLLKRIVIFQVVRLDPKPIHVELIERFIYVYNCKGVQSVKYEVFYLNFGLFNCP